MKPLRFPCLPLHQKPERQRVYADWRPTAPAPLITRRSGRCVHVLLFMHTHTSNLVNGGVVPNTKCGVPALSTYCEPQPLQQLLWLHPGFYKVTLYSNTELFFNVTAARISLSLVFCRHSKSESENWMWYYN